MKRQIIEFLVESIKKDKPCVLLLVADSKGHSPGRQGFTMAVTTDSLLGTIGGGTIEKNMVNKARKYITEGKTKPEVFHRFHKISAGKDSSGMICGGEQTVVLYPLNQNHVKKLTDVLWTFSKKLNYSVALNITKNNIYCTRIEHDMPSHEFEEWESGNEKSWLYSEILHEKNTAYIFGGGHVCLELSPLLVHLGFTVIVLDERPFVNEANSHYGEVIIAPFETLADKIIEGQNSYAFIMTPSHLHDETVLRGLIGKNLKYVGMMASKTKVAEIFQHLRDEGISQEILDTIHSPIGLPIKSKTPEEIAISIVAEVIQVKNSL